MAHVINSKKRLSILPKNEEIGGHFTTSGAPSKWESISFKCIFIYSNIALQLFFTQGSLHGLRMRHWLQSDVKHQTMTSLTRNRLCWTVRSVDRILRQSGHFYFRQIRTFCSKSIHHEFRHIICFTIIVRNQNIPCLEQPQPGPITGVLESAEYTYILGTSRFKKKFRTTWNDQWPNGYGYGEKLIAFGWQMIELTIFRFLSFFSDVCLLFFIL